MDEIRELLKLAVDSMGKRTLNNLLRKDTAYQEIKQENDKAYANYIGLEMTESQRDVIDALLAKNYELGYELRANIYMAGMLDGYDLLRSFDLIMQ